MIGVTFFGLIFTPVFYVTTRWLGDLFKRRRADGEPAPPAIAHPAE